MQSNRSARSAHAGHGTCEKSSHASKATRRRASLAISAAVPIAAMLSWMTNAAHGQTVLAWDPGGSFGGSVGAPTGSGGNGTWDNGVTSDWSTSTGDTTWTSPATSSATPPDAAIFGGTVGTVTLNNTIIGANDLTFQTSGYMINAAAATDVLLLGTTGSTATPTLTTTALSGGNVTFNAAVEIGGVSGATASQAWNLGTGNTITFSGLEDNGVGSLNIATNGVSTVVLDAETSGALGTSGADATAAWVLSQSTSTRTWTFATASGGTAGTNLTVNGIITGNPTSVAGGKAIIWDTGGTLTLTSSASDATIANTSTTPGWAILGNSTVAISAGNGSSSATGVFGAQSNLVYLGTNSSTPTTGAILQFNNPVTISNAIQFSGNTTAGSEITVQLNNSGTSTIAGTLSNDVGGGALFVNEVGANTGTLALTGTINLTIASSSSNKTLTFMGNAPISITGTVADGGTATAGSIGYAGSSVLTIASSASLNEHGGTAVTSGTMLVNTSTTQASNTFSISGTGILGGTGTFAGAVNINNGGTLAPGAPGSLSTIGTLTVDNTLTLSSSDITALDYTLGASPSSGDDLVSATTLAVGTGNTTTVNFSFTANPALNQAYTLINASETDGNEGLVSSWSSTGVPGGDSVAFNDTSGVVTATFSAVPEPASLMILGLSALPLMVRRRRS